jgi:CRP-like cAMP-binding protein
VINAFFLLDVLITFRTAYYDDDGDELVIVPSHIARKYVTTWFVPDLLGSLPFDAMVTGANLNLTRLIKVVRLVRLFKIGRMLKLGYVGAFIEDKLGLSPSGMSLLILLVQVFFVGHLVACVLWGVSGVIARTPWWDRSVPTVHPAMGGSTMGSQYILSLYWTFTIMSTVGYGDIFPTTTPERLLNIFVILLGASVFGYMIANVSGLIQSLNSSDAVMNDKISTITEYLNEKQCPYKLQDAVIKHFRNFYKHASPFDVDTMLERLPQRLANEVLLVHHANTLKNIAVLKYIDNVTIRLYIFSLMKPVYYEPNEAIIKQGTLGTEIFFLTEGRAVAFKKKEEVRKPRERGRNRANSSYEVMRNLSRQTSQAMREAGQRFVARTLSRSASWQRPTPRSGDTPHTSSPPASGAPPILPPTAFFRRQEPVRRDSATEESGWIPSGVGSLRDNDSLSSPSTVTSPPGSADRKRSPEMSPAPAMQPVTLSLQNPAGASLEYSPGPSSGTQEGDSRKLAAPRRMRSIEEEKFEAVSDLSTASRSRDEHKAQSPTTPGTITTHPSTEEAPPPAQSPLTFAALERGTSVNESVKQTRGGAVVDDDTEEEPPTTFDPSFVWTEKELEKLGLEHVGDLAPGDFIGHLSVMHETVNLVTVVSATYATVFTLNKQDIIPLLSKQPTVSMHLQMALSRAISAQADVLGKFHMRQARSKFLVHSKEKYYEQLGVTPGEVRHIRRRMKSKLKRAAGRMTGRVYPFQRRNSGQTRATRSGGSGSASAGEVTAGRRASDPLIADLQPEGDQSELGSPVGSEGDAMSPREELSPQLRSPRVAPQDLARRPPPSPRRSVGTRTLPRRVVRRVKKVERLLTRRAVLYDSGDDAPVETAAAGPKMPREVPTRLRRTPLPLTVSLRCTSGPVHTESGTKRRKASFFAPTSNIVTKVPQGLVSSAHLLGKVLPLPHQQKEKKPARTKPHVRVMSFNDFDPLDPPGYPLFTGTTPIEKKRETARTDSPARCRVVPIFPNRRALWREEELRSRRQSFPSLENDLWRVNATSKGLL